MEGLVTVEVEGWVRVEGWVGVDGDFLSLRTYLGTRQGESRWVEWLMLWSQ